MNGNQVGLEPTTHGLSGNCVLLYDHLKGKPYSPHPFRRKEDLRA